MRVGEVSESGDGRWGGVWRIGEERDGVEEQGWGCGERIAGGVV